MAMSEMVYVVYMGREAAYVCADMPIARVKCAELSRHGLPVHIEVVQLCRSLESGVIRNIEGER